MSDTTSGPPAVMGLDRESVEFIRAATAMHDSIYYLNGAAEYVEAMPPVVARAFGDLQRALMELRHPLLRMD